MSAPRVYACFHAAGCKNPALTDLKYYFLLRAWHTRAPLAAAFIDVHRIAPAFNAHASDVRRELAARLQASDLVLLILSTRTAASAGWLSWEIACAADRGLPIVCAYTGLHCVDAGAGDAACWPDILHEVVACRRVPAVHVPFRPGALAFAFRLFALGDPAPAHREAPAAERARATLVAGHEIRVSEALGIVEHGDHRRRHAKDADVGRLRHRQRK